MRWAVGFVMIWALAFLNMRGAKLIGDSSKLFGVIAVAPFVAITVIGLFKMDRNRSKRSSPMSSASAPPREPDSSW